MVRIQQKAQRIKILLGYQNWLRNQVLSHRQAETAWQLLHSALGLAAINETIKSHLHDSLIHPQHKKLEVLSKAVEVLSKNGNKGIDTTIINTVNQLAVGASHVNFSNLFEEEEKRSIGISQEAPKTVELMSPDSFNLLFKISKISDFFVLLGFFNLFIFGSAL